MNDKKSKHGGYFTQVEVNSVSYPANQGCAYLSFFSSSFYSVFFFFAFLEHLEIYRFPVLRQLCLQSL